MSLRGEQQVKQERGRGERERERAPFDRRERRRRAGKRCKTTGVCRGREVDLDAGLCSLIRARRGDPIGPAWGRERITRGRLAEAASQTRGLELEPRNL